jgi:hypothetical protein
MYIFVHSCRCGGEGMVVYVNTVAWTYSGSTSYRYVEML